MKIIIGVTTNGPIPHLQRFLQSLVSNLEDISPHQVVFVCYDNGTINSQAVRDHMEACRKYGFHFVLNAEEQGQSFTWNRIAEYEEADLAVFFNHTIRFFTPGWLTRMLFFFEHNEQIGMVGLPIVHETGINHYSCV
mgnify:CR=1 FL=1